MREDEANFIGYLACIGSENRAFATATSPASGYMQEMLWESRTMTVFIELYKKLDKRPEMTWKKNTFWNRFEGKTAEVSTKVNDDILKAHSQTDGVLSYGRMVDLMLADFYSVIQMEND